jgi:hypothetical protein
MVSPPGTIIRVRYCFRAEMARFGTGPAGQNMLASIDLIPCVPISIIRGLDRGKWPSHAGNTQPALELEGTDWWLAALSLER